MSITALFTAAKLWNQPKCPSTEDWKKKMWCIRTMEYYSATKKKNNVFCSNVERTGGHYPKLNNSDTEGQILHVLIYRWELNMQEYNSYWRSHYIAQAGLELLALSDLSTSPSKALTLQAWAAMPSFYEEISWLSLLNWPKWKSCVSGRQGQACACWGGRGGPRSWRHLCIHSVPRCPACSTHAVWRYPHHVPSKNTVLSAAFGKSA